MGAYDYDSTDPSIPLHLYDECGEKVGNGLTPVRCARVTGHEGSHEVRPLSSDFEVAATYCRIAGKEAHAAGRLDAPGIDPTVRYYLAFVGSPGSPHALALARAFRDGYEEARNEEIRVMGLRP